MEDKGAESIDLTAWLVPRQGTSADPQTTEIQCTPLLGRCAISKVSTETLGEVILEEKPALVFNANGYTDLFAQFFSSPPSVQQAILDMYVPPEESAPMKKARKTVAALALFQNATVVENEKETQIKLIAIVLANAHSYFGRSGIAFMETFSLIPPRQTDLSALFVYGSKVSHSCTPNVSYSSKNELGHLRYKIIRPIAKGDVVAMSYLDKLWQKPTCQRRSELLESKAFICKCERCIGPDHSRAIRCVKLSGSCQGCATCINEDGESDVWKCSQCGTLDQSAVAGLLRTEKEMKDRMTAIQTRLQVMGGLESITPNQVSKLYNLACRRLSPVHYVSIQLLDILVTLCASRAGTPMGFLMGFGDARSLRLRAAEAGIQYVASCECVAAGCTGQNCRFGDENHPPVYECAQAMLFAWKDLTFVSASSWPNYAAAYLKRYIESLRVMFGKYDEDVLEIESVIEKIGVKDTPVASNDNQARKSTKGRTTNKKKKGKKKGRKK